MESISKRKYIPNTLLHAVPSSTSLLRPYRSLAHNKCAWRSMVTAPTRVTTSCAQGMSKSKKTANSFQNEVQTGTWNHQIHEKVKNMKSHENTSIYNTFDRLGHQKSADFQLKNHQTSCLQSKHVFWCLKCQEIPKNYPTLCPEGPTKFIKNRETSPLGPSRVPLCASVTHLISKWCQNGTQGPPNCPKMVIWGPWKELKINKIK